MKFLAFVFSALVMLPLTAQACEDFVSLDRGQVVDLMNTIRDPQKDPLDQFFAFETLMCSNQSGVRDLARRTAMKSTDPTLRGQVLLMAIMEMENIPVRLLEVDGLSKEQYERIKQRPIENFAVKYRDPANACLSVIRDKSCDPASLVSVNGTRLTIRTRYNGYDIDGDFSLDDGALKGILTFAKLNQTYPARIDLF